MTEEVERIKKINATKKWGHGDSAVAHCAKLLDVIADLEQQLSSAKEDAQYWEELADEIDAVIDAPAASASKAAVILDSVKNLKQQLTEAQGRDRKLTECLQIYAEPHNWMGETFIAFPDDMPRWDAGCIARSVLQPTEAPSQASAKNDTERLDWLESYVTMKDLRPDLNYACAVWDRKVFSVDPRSELARASLREAIDRLIQED